MVKAPCRTFPAEMSPNLMRGASVATTKMTGSIGFLLNIFPYCQVIIKYNTLFLCVVQEDRMVFLLGHGELKLIQRSRLSFLSIAKPLFSAQPQVNPDLAFIKFALTKPD